MFIEVGPESAREDGTFCPPPLFLVHGGKWAGAPYECRLSGKGEWRLNIFWGAWGSWCRFRRFIVSGSGPEDEFAVTFTDEVFFLWSDENVPPRARLLLVVPNCFIGPLVGFFRDFRFVPFGGPSRSSAFWAGGLEGVDHGFLLDIEANHIGNLRFRSGFILVHRNHPPKVLRVAV